MLELPGENAFKVRAYETGARAILSFPGDLEAGRREPRLLKVRGIGSGLFADIESLVKTGSLPVPRRVARAFSAAAARMPEDSRTGRAQGELLYEASASTPSRPWRRRAGRAGLRQSRGSAPRVWRRFSRGSRSCARARDFTATRAPAGEPRRSSRRPSRRASPPGSRSPEACGGARRSSATSTSSPPPQTPGPCRRPSAACQASPTWMPRARPGPPSGSRTASPRICASSPDGVPAALLYFTGSQEHNTQLRGRAKTMSLKLNEYGLFPSESPASACQAKARRRSTRRLGLAYIEPELREGRGEIEAAETGSLPRLLESGTCAASSTSTRPPPTAAIPSKKWSRRPGRRLHLRCHHRPQQVGRLRRRARRRTRARPARGDPDALPALPRLPDLPRHRGRHPGRRLDRLRRRVPQGIRCRRRFGPLPLRACAGGADAAPDSRRAQSVRLGPRSSERQAVSLARGLRGRLGRGARRGRGVGLRRRDQLHPPNGWTSTGGSSAGPPGRAFPSRSAPTPTPSRSWAWFPSAWVSPARAGFLPPRPSTPWRPTPSWTGSSDGAARPFRALTFSK